MSETETEYSRVVTLAYIYLLFALYIVIIIMTTYRTIKELRNTYIDIFRMAQYTLLFIYFGGMLVYQTFVVINPDYSDHDWFRTVNMFKVSKQGFIVVNKILWIAMIYHINE